MRGVASTGRAISVAAPSTRGAGAEAQPLAAIATPSAAAAQAAPIGCIVRNSLSVQNDHAPPARGAPAPPRCAAAYSLRKILPLEISGRPEAVRRGDRTFSATVHTSVKPRQGKSRCPALLMQERNSFL